jgi:putative membrane-bound dehydrogenase-like protein
MNTLRLLSLFLSVASWTASAQPVSLFDGKSLDQWESISGPIGGVPMWRVEDGLITGGSLTEQIARNDFLATAKSYGNFELRLKIRITGTSGFVNSGIQIRSQRAKKVGEMVGYQVDAGDGWWGKLYDEERRNKVIAQAADLAAVNAAVKKNDWNEYVIRAEGPRIRSWINGVAALNYTEADPSIPLEGRIGIQVHGGGKTLVHVKDITIEELPAPKPGEVFVGAPEASKPPAEKSKALTPDEERAAFKLPPGFEVELIAAEIPDVAGKFIAVVFDQKGRMWTMTAFEYPVDANENKAVADALYGNPGKDKVLIYDNVFGTPPPGGFKPRVWADGLAIPLGLLPYKDGAYVQHGPDIVFLSDTDNDGKADKREVILTGFGVQDSHLFPHQFTRAPGGWIWMAQGAFNYSKVRQPDDSPEKAIQFDQTRMAKFRRNGEKFTITSQGPCNIWGLVINGEGEAFIQEANDLGYPVMPFHEYANYPGCSDRQWKSYAPEFPGTAPDFRMGGTGLSGLALSDARGAWPGEYADVMYIANPITSQIQAIKMHRDGPRWRLEKLPDFINSSDPRFRPVAITFGPDGCLYIVDWYNEIISHNEVPRNHPGRDKTRGRIWRVKHNKQKPFEVPDFTKLSEDQVVAKLDTDSLAQSHLAWQTLADRGENATVLDKLERVIRNGKSSAARRIQALWAYDEVKSDGGVRDMLIWAVFPELLKDPNPNVRREAVKTDEYNGYTAHEEADTLKGLFNDPDPRVRVQVIRTLANHAGYDMALESRDEATFTIINALLQFVREPLNQPIAPSTRNGKPIKVREAYDREFERYLVRLSLEKLPDSVAAFLDSADAAKLTIEARLLASLALESKASAARVARLLPQLQRPPAQEEVLRLAEFPDEPGVGEALRAVLTNEKTRNGVLEALLATRTRLDATKLTPMLTDAGKQLIESRDDGAKQLGIRLADEFKLAALEPQLVALTDGKNNDAGLRPVIRALGAIGSSQVELLARLATESGDAQLRDDAIAALASSKAETAGERLLALWPKLDTATRRKAMDRLAAGKSSAKVLVAAIRDGRVAKADIDGPTFEKLQTVLGPNDPDLAPLLTELAGLFKPVLRLNGEDNAWAETGLTLEGPFTVECWVRLDPGIDNNDGILGSPGQLDINFYDAKLRVWVGGGVNDAIISKKPMTPDIWTHVAVARDEKGLFKLYQDGELVSEQAKPATQKFENVRIAWTQPGKGTAGALSEFRIWNRERTASEIAANFDTELNQIGAMPPPILGKFERAFMPKGAENLLCYMPGNGPWGKLQPGAKTERTSDAPPLISEDEAKKMFAKFEKFRGLATQGGDAARGKTAAVLCQTCHLFKGQGASIGPDLSGVGAMGTEAILRNILTPNAAMENGYRIYRVELKNGDLVDAFFVSEDKDAVIVRLPGTPDRRIPRSDIRSAKYLRRSLMPEGLLDAMPEQQVSDLFAYLMSLK